MAHGHRHRNQALYLDQNDPSQFMLGLPKAHPKMGGWFVFTIFTGIALALALFVIETLIF